MSGLTTARWNNVLDALMGTTALVAPTTPMKLAIETAAGTAAAAGTEATGYTRPNIASNAASAASINNNASITIPFSATNNCVALAVYDSAGTPVRNFWGGLSTARSVVSGDSLLFAAGSIVINGTS